MIVWAVSLTALVNVRNRWWICMKTWGNKDYFAWDRTIDHVALIGYRRSSDTSESLGLLWVWWHYRRDHPVVYGGNISRMGNFSVARFFPESLVWVSCICSDIGNSPPRNSLCSTTGYLETSRLRSRRSFLYLIPRQSPLADGGDRSSGLSKGTYEALEGI